MPARLDTRARRQDLTSRECCSLISGTLAGLIGIGLSTNAVKNLVRLLYHVSKQRQDDVEAAVVELYNADAVELARLRDGAHMLGAVLGTLEDNARGGAMETALLWIVERDDRFWEALKAEHAIARQAINDLMPRLPARGDTSGEN